jgi:hypothetical protein
MKIKGLRIRDFINGQNVTMQLVSVITETNIPFDLFSFQTIVGVINSAKTKYCKNDNINKTSCDIRTFINRSKKGSSRFRKILATENLDYIPHNIVKFSK